MQAREPLLRPHKHSRQHDEWSVDGGEQVLFQRFALFELHALPESLPCVLLFLVHSDGRSSRLVAQNQNGSIILAVAFQKVVEAKEVGSSVTVNDEKITFTSVEDAHFLGCLIESNQFYYLGRKVNHTSLEDLKAYMLLTAVKNLVLRSPHSNYTNHMHREVAVKWLAYLIAMGRPNSDP